MLVLVKRYQRLPATAPNRANEQVSVLVKLYRPRHSVPTDEGVSALVKLSPPRLLIVTTPSSKSYFDFVVKADNQIPGNSRDPTSQTHVTCPSSSNLGRTPFPSQLDHSKTKCPYSLSQAACCFCSTCCSRGPSLTQGYQEGKDEVKSLGSFGYSIQEIERCSYQGCSPCWVYRSYPSSCPAGPAYLDSFSRQVM